MVRLSNISIREWKSFLESQGCHYYRTKGGHEIWGKKELTRSLTFQTHIDPIPEMVIRSNRGLAYKTYPSIRMKLSLKLEDNTV